MTTEVETRWHIEQQAGVNVYNRLGITLVADLYVPRNIDRSRRHAALVVGGPYGAVKEQASGLYAQTMAERGFIAIAHDPSYVGESGGQPHGIASSEALVEDFSAAVDFLGGLAFVDRDRIGVIGVCGSGAGHVDLDDRRNLIPWDKLTSFFARVFEPLEA
jgi:fermentation-respiration switch protein FrsA (DUF1100 family)